MLKCDFIEDTYESGKHSMPYAVGTVWGNNPPHAMNIAVPSDGAGFQVKIIEPQDGTFHDPAKKRLYDIYPHRRLSDR